MKIGGIILTVASIFIGCAKPAEDPGITELETVEVGAAPDAELSTELDEQARQVSIDVGGELPNDIPSDLPIYSPSSLVDFGEIDSRRRYIAVDTSAVPSRVRSDLTSQLAAVGWELSTGTETELVLAKSGHSLTVVIEDLKPGTRLRYEYEPRR
ncbi:MAG: hypothetical protein P8Y44_03840 [Acidobacteriota bacterium]